MEAENVILVPFFVAEGWHTATTIPKDLELDGDVTRVGGRTIWYAPPVGTLPQISEVILALIEDRTGEVAATTAVNRTRGGAVESAHGSPPLPTSADEPARGPALVHENDEARFLGWIDAQPDGATFLQLGIRRRSSGSYELRHVDDARVPLEALEQSSNPERALEIARYSATGEYRPLRTAATLRNGWVLALQRDEIWRAISLLYPATIQYWLNPEVAERRSRSYAEWAARQTGIYSKLRALPAEALPQVVEACCVGGRCLRTRLWRYDAALPPDPTSESGGNNGIPTAPTIPCPEPCTLFATIAREILYADTACDAATDPAP